MRQVNGGLNFSFAVNRFRQHRTVQHHVGSEFDRPQGDGRELATLSAVNRLRLQLPIVLGDRRRQRLVHGIAKNRHDRPWPHQDADLADQPTVAIDQDCRGLQREAPGIASPKKNDRTLAVHSNNRRTRSCGMPRGSALLLGGQADGAVLRGDKDEGSLWLAIVGDTAG